MPVIRDEGGPPIEFLNARPQVWTPPDQATVVPVDTTATQTLTNKTLTSPTITNPTFTGPTPVAVTSATVALGATHTGRVVLLNRATGIAASLPLATGTGSKYELVIGTTFTGSSSITTAQATDVMAGTALLLQDSGDTIAGFATTNATTLTLFNTDGRNGGIRGGRIVLTDVATNLWSVSYTSDASGSESTPFS